MLISLVIANYNGQKFIKGCIESILKSDYKQFEIIIVDDHSTDDSGMLLKKCQKNQKITVFFSDHNKGLSQSNNIGADIAKGEVLFFINIDCKLDKSCLSAIASYFKKNSQIGAAQPKLIRAVTKRVDSVGHFISILGLPYELGVGEESSKYLEPYEIFAGKNAALAVRKTIFKKIGGFDSDYLIYGEDTDLCWRVWISGQTIIFIPNAKVYHYERSSVNAKTKYRIYYEGAKNNINYLIKNAPAHMLITMLPLNIMTWTFISFKLIVQNNIDLFIWIWKGILWNVFNIHLTLQKRRKTNSFAKKRDIGNFIYGPFTSFELMQRGARWLSKL